MIGRHEGATEHQSLAYKVWRGQRRELDGLSLLRTVTSTAVTQSHWSPVVSLLAVTHIFFLTGTVAHPGSGILRVKVYLMTLRRWVSAGRIKPAGSQWVSSEIPGNLEPACSLMQLSNIFWELKTP